jgi:hypothetical protein
MLQRLLIPLVALVALGGVGAPVAATTMPPQLRVDNYVACLRNGAAPIDMDAYAGEINVGTGSYAKLLAFLAGYPDARPFGTGWLIDRAIKRWATPYVEKEAVVVRRLFEWSKTEAEDSITPSMLWKVANEACGGTQHPMCAAITLHNVMRALGRSSRYGKNVKDRKKWLPTWWFSDLNMPAGVSKEDKQQERKVTNAIRRVLIPLQRCLAEDTHCLKRESREKWGQWYHGYGVMAFGIHSYMTLGAKIGSSAANFAVLMNKVQGHRLNGAKMKNSECLCFRLLFCLSSFI